MRQGNGTDLLGMNDPRSATIGVIYVSPTDDRTSVFAAILTQEKLKREHILVVLPDNNKAFESAQDFDDLKTVKRKLNGDLIFVAPEDSMAADMARQRQFPVYASLEEYTEWLREDGTLDVDVEPDDVSSAVPDSVATERRGGLFGARRSVALDAGAAAGGAALGAAVSGRNVRANPDLDDDDDIDGADDDALPASPPPVDTPFPQQRASSVPATPGRVALDDDDALDEPGPAAPISRRSSNAGATGYIPADKLRQRGRSAPLAGVPVDDDDDEDDDWEPLGPSVAAGAASGALAGVPASRAGVPATPLSNRPNPAVVDADEAPSDIIDLQPVARKRGPRSTLKLNDGTSGVWGAPAAGDAEDDDLAQPSAPAATPPLRKRRTGSMATAAAGGALAGGGVGASAGSSVGSAGRPVPGALPSRRAVPPNRRRRPSRGRLWLLLLLLLLLTAIIAIPVWAMLGPASFQTAVANPLGHVLAGVAPTNPTTVTITPASKTESNNFVVHAVTKNPDATNLQVSMRNLAANPPAQTKTVTGTGTGHTPATYAHGTITFYSLNSNAVPLGAGIVFDVNGIHVVTERSVVISGAQLPTAGSATVPAHATTAGTVGNLEAGAISQTCCSTGVKAISGQFIGGQDPVAYTYVQQGDVDGVVNPLVNTLVQQAKTTFDAQLRSNEHLAGDPQCKPNTVVPTNNVGPQGHRITSVQVTVSASCTGVVYDYQGAQNVTQQRLQLQATRDLGANYKLVGSVIPAVKSVTRQGDNVTMLTNAEGIWVYQFDNNMKQRLAHLLAGKKLADAQRLLAQQTGVKSADIKLNSGNTLPTDPTQITIDIKGVTGLSGGNGNGGTPAAAGATPTPGAGKGTLFPFIDQIVKFLKG